MALLRTLLMLCGSLAVLTLGALPASAAGPAAPPCHETSGAMHHGDTPAQTPTKAIKVMACCVMCVTAPLPAPVEAAVVAARTDLSPLPVTRLNGHAPAPEHGPPRA
ncbi:MAG: hypothetical protein REJ23_03410 [Brevundimonas sp.]|nr:hypothetical protein [Brevundimonas sp.]